MDKNIVFVTTTSGESIIIYDSKLSLDELKQWVEKACKTEVIDIVYTKQEDLQYLCIDNRVWQDEESDAAVLRFIGKEVAA